MNFSFIETSADARRHELLADLAEQTAVLVVEKLGTDQDKAIDVGNALADFVSQHWAGQSIYITGDSKHKLSKRDWEIYQRMQRGNAHELAKEYGISFVRIYQIYRRCLEIARAKTQPSLFGEPGEDLSTGGESA